MNYRSLGFLIFSACIILVYYLVKKKHQKYVLLAANLLFFLLSRPKHLLFLVVSMLASFFSAKKIGRIWEQEAEQLKQCADASEKKAIRDSSRRAAKRYLLLAFFITIGLLAVFKYTGFALENLNLILSVFNLEPLPLFNIVLPIGISFYTFMAIGYMLDVYWKRYPAEGNLLNYSVFLSYFPHVIQGPIDRYDKLRPQIQDGVDFCYKNLASGSLLLFWGLFKKVVIADQLCIFVDTVYNGWENYHGFAVFAVATALYSIQIYADFSGCIDIVSGVSEILGIRLAKNFNHPYFSRTMPEFWRRWHMSLMEWFKDYIYYPVSTSKIVKRVKKNTKLKDRKKAGELFATCFPALIVWLVTGIWHGASWNFVVWGLFHAALIILSNIFYDSLQSLNARLRINTQSILWCAWQIARTFTLCCIGRVFFRADSLASAFGIIRNTFSAPDLKSAFTVDLLQFGLDQPDFLCAIVCMLILLAVDVLAERIPLRERIANMKLPIRWGILYALIFAVLIFGSHGPSYNAADFIYGGF